MNECVSIRGEDNFFNWLVKVSMLQLSSNRADSHSGLLLVFSENSVKHRVHVWIPGALGTSWAGGGTPLKIARNPINIIYYSALVITESQN